jgi:hypothetical protein
MHCCRSEHEAKGGHVCIQWGHLIKQTRTYCEHLKIQNRPSVCDDHVITVHENRPVHIVSSQLQGTKATEISLFMGMDTECIHTREQAKRHLQHQECIQKRHEFY